MNPVIDELNDLATHLNSLYDNIDRGGCAVVAAQMARRLQGVLPVRVVTANSAWVPGSLDEIRPNVLDSTNSDHWVDNGIGLDHVLIEFKYEGKEYAFDCTRGARPVKQFWQNTYYERVDGEFTLEEAISFSNETNWNDTFDRAYVPMIRGIITKRLKKIVSMVTR